MTNLCMSIYANKYMRWKSNVTEILDYCITVTCCLILHDMEN